MSRTRTELVIPEALDQLKYSKIGDDLEQQKAVSVSREGYILQLSDSNPERGLKDSGKLADNVDWELSRWKENAHWHNRVEKGREAKMMMTEEKTLKGAQVIEGESTWRNQKNMGEIRERFNTI